MSIKKIITVSGIFDILHLGHIELLKYAKSKGTILIVLINSDNSTKKFKGPKRPINSQNDRKKMLLSIKYVDKVFIFKEDEPLKILSKIKPSIHIKSKDALPERVKNEQKIVEKYGGKVLYYKCKNSSLSTTNIIKKINEMRK